jgi:poly-gamma-glutamate capsule biosynthesis protein CapA/YwtB (metallophosphatase superfamily)
VPAGDADAEAGQPTPKPQPVAGCHQFRLPPSYAGHLRDAGFQLMNIANNHTLDQGQTGLDNTRDALDSVGIKFTGRPRPDHRGEVKGRQVAVVGFSIYSWTQNLNDISGSAALVKKAAKQADIVVVQMQGGAEGSDKSHVVKGHENFLGEDRGDLIAFTHKMIDAGADVVFGHGPHIMRGWSSTRAG